MVNDTTTRDLDLVGSLLKGKPGIAKSVPAIGQSFDQFFAARDNSSNAAASKNTGRQHSDSGRKRSENSSYPAIGSGTGIVKPEKPGSGQNGQSVGQNESSALGSASSGASNANNANAQGTPGNSGNNSETGQTSVINTETGKVSTDLIKSIVAEAEQSLSEADEAIIAMLAQLFNITPEAVLDLLKSMNVEPGDLADPVIANQVLQKLLTLSNPAQVLTLENYQEALTQLTEAVKEITEAEFPKDVRPALQILSGLIAEVKDKKHLVVDFKPLAEEVKTESAKVMIETVDGTENETDDDFEQEMSGGKQNRSDRTPAFVPEPAQNTAFAGTAVPILQNTADVLLNNNQQPTTVAAVSSAQNNSVQLEVVRQTAETSAQMRAEPKQVMEQILSHVKTISAEGFSELRMTLRPAELGDVNLRVTVQNGIVMAMFVAENQRVKEIIESQFNLLRDALEEQGIQVSQLFVSVNDNDADKQMGQYIKAQQEAMRRLRRVSGTEGEEPAEEEPPLADPSVVHNNTVDFSA